MDKLPLQWRQTNRALSSCSWNYFYSIIFTQVVIRKILCYSKSSTISAEFSFFFSFLSLLFCSPLDALLCYPVSEKGLETAKYWMLWPWLSWKYFFVHLILNNLRSAVDTECLGAGKLARHLCGHLGPAGVGAEGGSSREILTGLTERTARIGVESLQGRHSFVLYTSVICPAAFVE